MFAEPGEVYKQESVPGIIRIADSSNENKFSAFANQICNKRDDVILNMNNKVRACDPCYARASVLLVGQRFEITGWSEQSDLDLTHEQTT
jgi:hypothetical protein